MTLSRWLRDYLYIPHGGSRGGRAATYRNLWLTMVLGGLWHGAAWTFVVWGALHGFALAAHRLLTERTERRQLAEAAPPTPAPAQFGTAPIDTAPIDTAPIDTAPPPGGFRLPPFVRWLATFHLVCLAWIPFRARTFGEAGDFVAGLFTAPLGGPVNTVAIALIVGALAAQLAPAALGHRLFALYARIDPTFQSAALGVWVFLVASLGPEGVAPFIYFQF
jgi:D-alanyl-lipoteichoic acid acyltransferase DltB (MBOAT superfamily)